MEMAGPILVMGEALIDLVPATDGAYLPMPGGAPANVAAALARLGVPSSFAGTLGGDAFGRLNEDRLRGAGVDLSLCGLSALPSAFAVADPTPGGNRYDFHLRDTGTFQITGPPGGLERFSAVYVGGLAAVVQPAADAVLETAMSAAKRSVLVVDPNVRIDRCIDPADALTRLRALCALAHIVKTSDEDSAMLWPGLPPEQACRELADEGRLVLLTRGAGGSTAFLPHRGEVSVPSLTVGVIDSIGARDAFMAAVLARLFSAGDLHDRNPGGAPVAEVVAMLEFAALIGAAACQQAGADLPPELPL
ncbi:PfkB family carbohydrate kinase [Streptomyces sp. V4I23]|uniref:PfkB family carbohydrate kinase n=1 Tax=Streptomyces sp. V4I23 TaxID=3042282 RepID=UPI0027D8D5C6|nr:PfkB family carbohydrate kinase [Streptomyces sp. V4I23]